MVNQVPDQGRQVVVSPALGYLGGLDELFLNCGHETMRPNPPIRVHEAFAELFTSLGSFEITMHPSRGPREMAKMLAARGYQMERSFEL
eukprot:CAMPEP_0170628880 /NCGR_PEP_ID=MMETSP0224-20130122/32978_1 /TAXON_ID=285029 /ORGANISM="Togula jolla, Strain CCCM 725" /LENGTH=88 /DNA_ID=CAMNT_0010956451 /DNA_START=1 /DNA_END=265 /DNA_ORIENTATION=-